MMGKSQRRKGHAFERHIANALRAVFPSARRGLDQTQGGREPDVAGTPYWLEAKHHNLPPSTWKVFEQADEARGAAGDSRPPMVVVKKTRGFTYWALKEADMLALLEKAYGANSGTQQA